MVIAAREQQPTPLRRFVDERGIRYQWLAEQLGISPSHLARLLSGERPLTTAHAARLAELFGVPAETFAGHPDEAA